MTAEGGPWEVYWTDPGLERDPSKWRTELFQPVAASANAGREVGGANSRAKKYGTEKPEKGSELEALQSWSARGT